LAKSLSNSNATNAVADWEWRVALKAVLIALLAADIRNATESAQQQKGTTKEWMDNF